MVMIRFSMCNSNCYYIVQWRADSCITHTVGLSPTPSHCTFRIMFYFTAVLANYMQFIMLLKESVIYCVFV